MPADLAGVGAFDDMFRDEMRIEKLIEWMEQLARTTVGGGWRGLGILRGLLQRQGGLVVGFSLLHGGLDDALLVAIEMPREVGVELRLFLLHFCYKVVSPGSGKHHPSLMNLLMSTPLNSWYTSTLSRGDSSKTLSSPSSSSESSASRYWFSIWLNF